MTDPLPLGMPVALDAGTRMHPDGALVGGSPGRIFRLNARAREAFESLRSGVVATPDAAALGRRLSDAGAVHPMPARTTTTTDVTVVIPAYGRAAGLDACLARLGGEYPVIVVDDGSGSTEAAELEDVTRSRGARLLRRESNGGPGAARNTALGEVGTGFVAFLDSDCLPPPNWIPDLMGHFADPLVAAAAPRIVPAGTRPRTAPGPGTFAQRFAAARPVLDLGDRPARVQPMTTVSYLPTAALVLRRAALASIEGPPRFDETLRYGEDVDLVWRLLEAGHRIRYDPRVRVDHVEPDGWGAMLRRRFAYGTSAALLEDRHPGKVSPLILVAAPASAVAAGLARRPVLACAALAAGYVDIAATLRRSGLPVTGIIGPLSQGVRETFFGSGHWVSQFALPVAVLAAARGRLGRKLALLAWVCAAPTRDWLRSDRKIPLPAWIAGVLLDDAAYGAGVWAGTVHRRGAERRHLRAVLPRWRWHLVKPPS